MDPDTNLAQTRELVAQLLAQLDKEEEIDTADVDRLCELVQALDQWIGRGGFLPNAWSGEDLNAQTFMASRSEFSRLLQDYGRLLEQVTETQTSNTALLEENRHLKERIIELSLKDPEMRARLGADLATKIRSGQFK